MMRVAAAVLLALACACAPEKARDFELGLLGPVGPGLAAAAREAGLSIRESVPAGADEHSAAVSFKGPSGAVEERMADWSHLRLLVARAVVRERTGVFFTLPKSPDGRGAHSYPEEWQALARVARETAALRPIIESGVEDTPPLAVPEGIEARAWRYQGRLYVLLVNDGADPILMPQESLQAWRALFEVRADARELLVPCDSQGRRCLPPERALWLEGRIL